MVRAERAFGHLQLAQDHRAVGLEPRHHGGVLGRHVVAMDRHAGGGGNARGVAQILHRNRHAVQWPAPLACGDLAVGARGVGQGLLAGRRWHSS